MIRKKKRKEPTKAELEALEEWKKLNLKWDKLPKFARKEHPKSEVDHKVYPKIPDFRKGPDITSLQTKGLASTAKKEAQTYTGTKMKGIGTLHKSNSVPIFSDEEAIDIARMRR